MSGNRYIRQRGRKRGEPKIGRMFLVSFGIHLLLFIVFSGLIEFSSERERRPVYYVDLTRMPVAKPQAGRPDARPKATKNQQKKVQKKVQKKPVKKSVSKKPVKKTVSKPKPDSVKRPVDVASDDDIKKKLDALKRQQEREELKQKLADLAAGDSRDEDALDDTAPLGMPEGQGDEEGAGQLVWLEAFIKDNWSLSRYQIGRTDIEAEAWVVYNREGRLVDYALQESSGEKVFDDSIKSAILKSRQLEFEPVFADKKITINFNLKDLMDQ